MPLCGVSRPTNRTVLRCTLGSGENRQGSTPPYTTRTLRGGTSSTDAENLDTVRNRSNRAGSIPNHPPPPSPWSVVTSRWPRARAASAASRLGALRVWWVWTRSARPIPDSTCRASGGGRGRWRERLGGVSVPVSDRPQRPDAQSGLLEPPAPRPAERQELDVGVP